MIRKAFIAAIIFCTLQVQGQETLKVMFYNLLEFPSASPGNRDVILRNIMEEYQPDIFMVCELESEQGANDILNTSLTYSSFPYGRAAFQPNTSSGADIQQLIFYRSDKFSLEGSEIIQTTVRDINRYNLQLSTANGNSDPLLLNIYVSHLKASQGSSNENLRLSMVNEFTSTLNTLDPNSFVIFAGDLNVYDSDEPAYQELLDPTNDIVLKDPIDSPGDWSNNINFQSIHTQSTRESSGPFGAGAGGGLDDRFDFILLSENMLSNPRLRYVTDSYKAYGNNGNCYNQDVSASNCTGEFSQQIRTRLFGMSDHLPVVLELETNEDVILSGTEFDVVLPEIKINYTLVKDKVSLDIPEVFFNEVSFTIYNTLGQKIKHISTNNSQKNLIDVTSFPEGIYYIKTNLLNNNTLKFIKTNF